MSHNKRKYYLIHKSEWDKCFPDGWDEGTGSFSGNKNWLITQERTNIEHCCSYFPDLVPQYMKDYGIDGCCMEYKLALTVAISTEFDRS